MARYIVERTFPEGLEIPITPEAIRKAADRITRVSVLDPYFYQ